ncbi:MAG: L,D-transpeptidase family protein [Gammaproteobacteria bacterium]|nr:L,D-transpeptidase family protein [Gammaproteobacteria bacterium]MCP5424155.1 L,D-transpeptidase family protein [Gammaproteobacteria bacterium]
MAAGKYTSDDIIEHYDQTAGERLRDRFHRAGVEYPPQRILLFAVKDQKRLELWAQSRQGWHWVHAYPIQAASGSLGPKLMEGDAQVPEGVYGIEYLNPNSAFHLSMKLNYPNAFDWEKARRDGRTNPGSDIFIHGKSVSSGCLAMGDPSIEELYILVHAIGKEQVRVIIAPTDPREGHLIPPARTPPWVSELYQRIEQALAEILDN